MLELRIYSKPNYPPLIEEDEIKVAHIILVKRKRTP